MLMSKVRFNSNYNIKHKANISKANLCRWIMVCRSVVFHNFYNKKGAENQCNTIYTKQVYT